MQPLSWPFPGISDAGQRLGILWLLKTRNVYPGYFGAVLLLSFLAPWNPVESHWQELHSGSETKPTLAGMPPHGRLDGVPKR
jgi:hypothetical protein